MYMQFRPISTWPGEQTTRRKRAPFKAQYNNTLNLLDRELRYLGAETVVLEAAVDEQDIRLDGHLRASCNPRHSGIIVSFNSKHGPLRYACDTYDKWQMNLRAIALTLERLRAVERYGAVKHGEQYKGWKQLPASSGDTDMTFDQAAVFVTNGTQYGPSAVYDADIFRAVYRQKAAQFHPDNQETGDTRAFQTLQVAKDIIQKAVNGHG